MPTKNAQFKMARYRRAIIPWLGFYFLIHLSSAVACSCIFLTLHEQFHNAQHVFIGRITGVQATEHRADHPQWRGMLGTFQVLHNFKGHPETLKYIETGLGPSDCGISLAVGRTYLLFADKMGSVDICSGSRVFDPEDQKNAGVLKELKSYAGF